LKGAQCQVRRHLHDQMQLWMGSEDGMREMLNCPKAAKRDDLWQDHCAERYSEWDSKTLAGLKKYMLVGLHGRVSKMKRALVSFVCEAGSKCLQRL
jgi:hypothetical protein